MENIKGGRGKGTMKNGTGGTLEVLNDTLQILIMRSELIELQE